MVDLDKFKRDLAKIFSDHLELMLQEILTKIEPDDNKLSANIGMLQRMDDKVYNVVINIFSDEELDLMQNEEIDRALGVDALMNCKSNPRLN